MDQDTTSPPERNSNSITGSETRTDGQTTVISVLAFCSFLVDADSLVTVPLIPAIVETTAIHAERGVLLVTAYAAAYMVSAPIFGTLSDQWGRKRTISLGVLLLGGGTVLTGFGSDLPSLLLFRAVTGIGAGMILPVGIALVGDIIPYDQRGRAVGVIMAAFTASTILGVPLGSYLAGLESWRWTFWCLGIIAGVMLGAIQLGIPSVRPRATTTVTPRSIGEQFRVALSNRSIFVGLVAMFLWYGGLQGMSANVGIFYASRFGLDTAEIGAVFVVVGVGSAVGSIAGGRLADRLDKKTIIAYASVFAAAGVLGLSLVTQGVILAAAVHSLWAFTTGSGQATLATLISELSPESRGTVLAVTSAFMYAGATVATALSSILLEQGGFLSIGILSASAILSILPLVRYRMIERPRGESTDVCIEAQRHVKGDD